MNLKALQSTYPHNREASRQLLIPVTNKIPTIFLFFYPQSTLWPSPKIAKSRDCLQLCYAEALAKAMQAESSAQGIPNCPDVEIAIRAYTSGQADAVFAIVIILMAIEIHIPETEEIKSAVDLSHALSHLLPTLARLTG